MTKTPGKSEQLPLRFEASGFGGLAEEVRPSNVVAFVARSTGRVIRASRLSQSTAPIPSEAEIIQKVLTQAKKIGW
ncbi:hypothetical protein VLK31_34535 [Variovorax sp. H27-G14]|uniref:hypothetical protein n=1 Tax=Variovorax sp. H27-G14 TaxID=3111914 RepID=UPI0038FCA2EB